MAKLVPQPSFIGLPTGAADLHQKHLLADPLANPPAPWAPPSNEEQPTISTGSPPGSPPPLVLILIFSIVEFVGLCVLYNMIEFFRSGSSFSVFLLFFYAGWSGMLTFFVTKEMDPGGCHRAIDSLRKGGDDAATAEILDQLRQTPPQVAFMGRAWHTESSGSGKDRKTSTVTTYSAQWYLEYGRWRDLSGKIAGLEKYSIAVVNIRTELSLADQETEQVLEDSHATIIGHIKENHPRENMSCSRKVVVNCPAFPVDGEGMLLTRSPGVGVPCWMNRCVYYTMCLLSIGTLFRIFFAMRIPTVIYRLHKEVGVGGLPTASGRRRDLRAGAAQTLETPLLQEA